MMFVLIQPEAKLLLFPTQNYFLTCFALLAVAIVGTQIGELQKENLEKVEPQLLHNWPAALCLPPGCRKTFKLWKLKQNSLSDTHNLHLLTALPWSGMKIKCLENTPLIIWKVMLCLPSFETIPNVCGLRSSKSFLN